MKVRLLAGLGLLLGGTGCSVTGVMAALPATLNSVMPSNTGVPNSVVASWPYEYVSVQGVGQIFRYNVSSGSQVSLGAPYETPCQDPSGMVVTKVAGASVMAVVCYDTGSLLTLTVQADGSLTPLGSVAGLAAPFPGIALDGTNVLVPLYGKSQAANGGVAKVSLATPSQPVITGVATLTSPFPGAYANPGALAVSAGSIYVAAGSESAPLTASSTVQVVDEATMTVVGSPLVVAHSPQHLVVQGGVAYVTFYDAAQLESIDVSVPASVKVLQVFSLSTPTQGCAAIPVAILGTKVYVGCYAQGGIETVDIRNPAAMVQAKVLGSVASPQNFSVANDYLLVTDGVNAGQTYQVGIGLLQ